MEQSSFKFFTINLEHDIDEQYQYQPGEILRGVITIVLNRRTQINTIFITIVGQGVVAWDDDDGRNYQASEEYINAKHLIFNSSSANLKIFEKGKHDFPFEYQLPGNLPSSFIGKYGNVAYMLKATAQGDKPTDRCLISEPFLVLQCSPIPANSDSPVIIEKVKRLRSGCSFGKVKIGVQLNKSAAVPGNDLYIHAEVQNHSPCVVTAIQAALIMKSSYTAQANSIEFRQIITKRRDDFEIDSKENRVWSNIRLSIPPYLPETKLEHCDIIDIEYFFQFRVEISGGRDIRLEKPYILGSKPIGLELPNSPNVDDDQYDKKPINFQWVAGTRGLETDKSVQDEMENSKDTKDRWFGGVPEMRPDSMVLNPLFIQNPQSKIAEPPTAVTHNTKL